VLGEGGPGGGEQALAVAARVGAHRALGHGGSRVAKRRLSPYPGPPKRRISPLEVVSPVPNTTLGAKA
jgi:hypothetical protein